MKTEIRTVRDFVEEMAAEGNDLRTILTVAFNSRWRNMRDEIKEEYRKLKERSVANIK